MQTYVSTSPTKIDGDCIEGLALRLHAHKKRSSLQPRPGESSINQSRAACIMYTNGLLSNTDALFAPYRDSVAI